MEFDPQHAPIGSSPTSGTSTSAALPVAALIVLVCGLAGSWLAAGSLGWLAPPLEKSLVWLALGTIAIVAIASPGSRTGKATGRRRSLDRWLLPAAVLLAVLMTASSLAVVNILAVTVLLASVAAARPGAIARAAGPLALAAAVLAIFRLVCEGTATGWAIANAVGRAQGHFAAVFSSRPLLIGASFGGVDFLVVMIALAIAWHLSMPRRSVRWIVCSVLGIIAAQSAYLIALAFTPDLVAMLPPVAHATPTKESRLDVWTWANALHEMLPWYLPVLGTVLQTVVAGFMFRSIVGPESRARAAEAVTNDMLLGTRQRRVVRNAPPADVVSRVQGARLRFAPAALLFVAAVSLGLAPVKPDLTGRRIVAYDDGSLDWTTSDPGTAAPGMAPRYGLLGSLVASLGGELVLSKDLSPTDLGNASVLIVLPPGDVENAAAHREKMSPEMRQRIWSFVRSGGGLVVAGEPENHLAVTDNVQNALLEPTGMSFRDDTVDSLTERWEYNLVSSPHAATATSRPGRGSFSIDRAASLRLSWPAAPLLASRWCWNELGSDPARSEALPYGPGSRLGDLVLAAQENIGQGSVVVLGDAACLSNDGMPFSYTFCGPLLASLAAKDATPLAWWRQFVAIVAVGTAIAMLFWRYDALSLAAAALALALAVVACNLLNDGTSQLLPAGGKAGARPIFYVDGSHLERMGNDPWRDDGIGRYMRVLAASGYLPLLAPDLSRARLQGSKMLISIAPGRAFSEAERKAVDEYVVQGGNFLSMTGAPDANPSRAMLEQFKLDIGAKPVPPWQNVPEAEPLGPMSVDFHPDDSIKDIPPGGQTVWFHAAWPVGSSGMQGNLWPASDREHRAVIAGNRRSVNEGQTFLLGDSQFALQKSLAPPQESGAEASVSSNAIFWRTILRSWLGSPDAQPQRETVR